MHENNTAQFGDKEIVSDALVSQKQITSGYNTNANECACETLKAQFMKILKDEHDIQHQVFKSMQSRGWYATESAEQQKINKAKQKYGSK